MAELDCEALVHNLVQVRRLAPGKRVIAVVKADAYGHGAPVVGRTLLEAGADQLAVVTLDEAAELRAAGIDGPILGLGGVASPEEAERAVALDVEPVLHGPEPLPWLARAAAAADGVRSVQVEVDTGMRRMGCPADSAPALMSRIAETAGLALAGCFTHLASADDPDPERSREQLRRFGEVLDAAERAGVSPPSVHVANSAGVFQAKELEGVWPAAVNAVRPGLMLYGVAPAPHRAGEADLRPALSVRSRVATLRSVSPGEPVGYGGTWRAERAGRIATVPVGYADGIPWSLANRGFALVGGERVPYAGRVSMDYVTLDVGAADVEVGDEVVLFGRSADGSGVLRVEELAAAAGTLAYELLVRVGRRLPRRVREAGASS